MSLSVLFRFSATPFIVSERNIVYCETILHSFRNLANGSGCQSPEPSYLPQYSSSQSQLMLLILLLNWSSTPVLNFLTHPTTVTFYRGDKCSHIETNIYECHKILLTILSYCKDGSYISSCMSFKISDVLLASNIILLVCFPFIKLTQISKFVKFKELRISSDMSLLILYLEI